MEKAILELFKARDAEEAFAIRFRSEERWLARSGIGSGFEPVWAVEIESAEKANRDTVDWDQVLERAVEAYRLSDPVLTNFSWPVVGR